MVKANYEPLGLTDVEEIIYQGGTMLGSSRTNPFKNPDDLNAVLANIKSAKFDAIVACGGEDTLGVAAKLYSQHGVPTSSWKSWDAMQDGLPGMSVWQAELIG